MPELSRGSDLHPMRREGVLHLWIQPGEDGVFSVCHAEDPGTIIVQGGICLSKIKGSDLTEDQKELLETLMDEERFEMEDEIETLKEEQREELQEMKDQFKEDLLDLKRDIKARLREKKTELIQDIFEGVIS